MLSIVTVHLNDLPGLNRTRTSLEALLDSDQIEWIVVDGGTALTSPEDERSFQAVRNLAANMVSEPDEGIYDAMNKGTRLARHDYVLYLNAGDTLHPLFDLQELVGVLQRTRPGMLWGDSWDLDHTGRAYRRKTRAPFWLRYGMAVCHQAVFFRRDLLGGTPFDVRYRIAADYDLLCRLYRAGCSIERSSIPVCTFDLVGVSSGNKGATLAEESAVRRAHFGLPAALDKALVLFKKGLWAANIAFPSVRAIWRRWI